MRRGSEPALLHGNHKNTTQNNAVAALDLDYLAPAPVTTGSVQATIAAINARSTSSSSVPRSLSASNGLTIAADMNGLGQYGGGQNNLRSSLRKTMVNTTYSVPMEDRSAQQSSPDSQYDEGSLNVMRRREPLGASGNKPERPK